VHACVHILAIWKRFECFSGIIFYSWSIILRYAFAHFPINRGYFICIFASFLPWFKFYVWSGKAIFSHSASAADCVLSGWVSARLCWSWSKRTPSASRPRVSNCYRISRLSSANAKHALAKLPIDKSGDDLLKFFPIWNAFRWRFFVEGAWILYIWTKPVLTNLTRVLRMHPPPCL